METINSYDILSNCDKNKDWSTLKTILKPRNFAKDDPRIANNLQIISKISEILTAVNTDISHEIKIIILKCLMNSCVNEYLYKPYDTENVYPYESYDSYEGVATWAVNAILLHTITNDDISKEELDIIRLSLQFICNFITFSCKTSLLHRREKIPKSLETNDFKNNLIKLIAHEHLPIVIATCALIHNALTQASQTYYNKDDKKVLILQLVKLIKSKGIQSALDTLIFLIKQPNNLINVYEDLSTEDQLVVLEIITKYIREFAYNKENCDCLALDAVKFLSGRFKRKSDLILKTVDTYLNNVEPVEITMLLDILGVLTSTNSNNSKDLQNDRSLLINCIFLLKSLHMAGKETNNFFTPIQKLSEMTISSKIQNEYKNKNDIQNHPAFGFKAALIRVIGNMVQKHKINQDLVRETNGIPLLLDSCNIDARNPLIIQWTILAIKNLCENNHENQEVIRSCTKVGVVDNAVIHEMGLTIHEEEDGKSIGIIPFVRKE